MIAKLLLNFLISVGCAGEKLPAEAVELPEPRYESEMSVEESLKSRRSIRSYKDKPLTITELSQLLWAAQGITADWGGRTAPSAGATYPLEVYVVVGEVENLEDGLYHYNPKTHTIKKKKQGDLRNELANAALGQAMIRKAPISFILTAIYERTTGRYGERGIRYVHMEVGHVGQNIYLQAETLGLGTVVVGAFYDDRVKDTFGIEEEPLYIIPVGSK
ncbi:MAG: SagB/ThcOx family dehydrogenase [candidate division WOR-3 bacterium]|nr:SagB/ThcOx family dehydrogenase [candidate division WOR-3 bacterium]